MLFKLSSLLICAQATDSLNTAIDSLGVNLPLDTLLTTTTTDTLPFKPKRAALLSTMLPGLGQAFNKQLYKTPIYPGAMAVSLSAHIRYRILFNNATDKLDKIPINLSSTDDSIPSIMRNEIRLEQAQSRRVANSALFMTSFFYIANIIDAYASAGIQNQRIGVEHSPLLAAYRSAALPGLGQVYNKQYWKVPVVWAALAGVGYFINYSYKKRKCYGDVYLNRIRYNYYDEALIERCFRSPASEQGLSNEKLLSLRDFHKNNFERAIIALGAVYVLNIADAMVYAHLKNFDIDDNLDLSIRPVFHYQPNDVNFAGVGIVLKL